MQVFKAYFLVIKKNLPSLLIYLSIFLFLAIILTKVNGGSTPSDFKETKCRVAFFNYDKSSVLTKSLKNYLSKNAVIVNLKDNTQTLQDALFFRDVEFILKVPTGFTKSFLSSKNNVVLEKTTVPDSMSGRYVDFLINKYLNLVKFYTKNLPKVSQSKIASYVENDLKLETKVKLNSYGRSDNTNSMSYYFSYLAYTIMIILILGITSIMMVFNDSDLRKRNLCSPFSSLKINIQLVLGSLAFSIAVWLVLIAFSFVTFGKALVSWQFTFLVINMFVFILVCLSISFLVGIFVKSRGAQSAIANVLSLGLSFISGVFVPQEFLGKGVHAFARFIPTYWYVKVINYLNELVVYNLANLKPIILGMLMQLDFAIGILAVALVLSWHKRLQA